MNLLSKGFRSNLGNGSSSKSRSSKLIRLLTDSRLLVFSRFSLTVLAIYWIADFFNKNWSGFVQSTVNIDWHTLGFAMCLVLVGLVPGAWAWQRLLVRELTGVSTFRGILIYLRSGIGKYTPGGALTFAIQYRMLQKEGAKTLLLLKVFVGTALAACLAALLLGLFSAEILLNLNPLVLTVPVALLSSILLGLACQWKEWPLFFRHLDSLGVPPPVVFSSTVIIMLFAWILTGLHLPILGWHTDASVVFLVSAYAFSAIAGIIFSVLPGAFGVRDGALLIVLTAKIEPADAMMIAIQSRVLVVAGDVVGSLVAALYLRSNLSAQKLKEYNYGS